MFGLELAMAGILTFANAPLDIECEAAARPGISVNPVSDDLAYDFSLGRAELDKMETDTVSPYGAGIKTHLNGAMSGEIQFNTLISYSGKTYNNELACINVNKIDVKIYFSPKIYIVKEYKKGSCEHDAVLEHEKKHLKITQLVLNKYTERISKTLALAVNKYGTTYGPVPVEQTKDTYEHLKNYYAGIVRDEEQRMYDELQELHQQLDSKEEYDRVAKMCR